MSKKEIPLRKLVDQMTVETSKQRYKKLFKDEPLTISLYCNSIVVKGYTHGIVEEEVQSFPDSEDKALQSITHKVESEERNLVDFRCPVYNIDSIYSGYSETAGGEFVSIMSVGGSNVVIMAPDEETRNNLINVLEEWLLIYGDYIRGDELEDIVDEDYDKLLDGLI